MGVNGGGWGWLEELGVVYGDWGWFMVIGGGLW